jgi:hypothetical protein
VLFVALTLLAAPVPQAVAQDPARPEPEELWRQFPLDDAQSNPQTPAEPSSAPVSPPKSPSTGDEGRDRSQTVQIAAIVLTMALVLILTTGMLAYATHGPFDVRAGLALRGWFRQIGDAVHAARTDQRQHSRASRLRRRLTVAGEALLRRTRALGSNLREQTAARQTPRPRTGLALGGRFETFTRSGESTADEELENLKADEQLEKLKAKLDLGPASTGSSGNDQLDILKAKRSERAPVDAEGPGDVETLKAKLARSAVAETARNVQKAKGKAKLDLADDAKEEEAPVSVYADGSGGTAGEPQTGRATDPLAGTNTGR